MPNGADELQAALDAAIQRRDAMLAAAASGDLANDLTPEAAQALAQAEAEVADLQARRDAAQGPPPAPQPPLDLSTITAEPPPKIVTTGGAPIVDLATIKAAAPSATVDRSPEKVIKLDITDSTRRDIAYALLFILAAVIVFHFAQSNALDARCPLVLDKLRHVVIDQTKQLCDNRLAAYTAVAAQTQTVFTALIGLVGSVVGFYFGQKNAQPTG